MRAGSRETVRGGSSHLILIERSRGMGSRRITTNPQGVGCVNLGDGVREHKEHGEDVASGHENLEKWSAFNGIMMVMRCDAMRWVGIG